MQKGKKKQNRRWKVKKNGREGKGRDLIQKVLYEAVGNLSEKNFPPRFHTKEEEK